MEQNIKRRRNSILDIPLEEKEQIAFVKWYMTVPIVKDLMYYIQNDSKKTRYRAKKTRLIGIRSGVFDYHLPLARQGYHGLWIELKRIRGGVISDEQRDWYRKMNERGFKAEFAFGWVAAKEIVEEYLK